MESRLVRPHLQTALEPRDAVVVWRRETVEQSGGFSAAAADPELALMIQVQSPAASGVRGRVVRTPEIFGWRHPRPLSTHVRLTARRQMAVLQAVSSLLVAGPQARVMLAYCFVTEVLTPCVEGWIPLATAVAAAAGWLPWIDVVLAVALVAFAHALVSSAALLVRGELPHAPEGRELTRLLVRAPLDVLLFGAAAAYARTAGWCAFVMSCWSRAHGSDRAARPIA